MSSAPVNHDPALTTANGSSSSPTSNAGPASALGGVIGDGLPIQLGALDSNQIISLLRHLPGVFNKLTEQGNLKEDAAQTLSNLSQATFASQHQLSNQHPYQAQVHTMQAAQQPPSMISDPGPSSHPRGPPNLGQLSALASASAMHSPSMSASRAQQDVDDGGSDGDDGGNMSGAGAGGDSGPSNNAPSGTGGRTRRSATMGSEEWSRQRKDNHKEVERRRRGNINEGINELGRIVPNGSGEKAKGAILSRAVQYIHHLKENEARNIEKWTLEKLLMDQAMGDLQAQLEEVRRLWDEERMARQRAESELEVLRGVTHASAGFGAKSKSPDGSKRRGEDGGGPEGEGEGGRDGKRQRVE